MYHIIKYPNEINSLVESGWAADWAASEGGAISWGTSLTCIESEIFNFRHCV
jgi:hypothetical protein